MTVYYDAILAERRRAAIIQERTFEIFALVREERHSLDGDRVCNRINGVLELAIAEISRKADAYGVEMEKLRKELDKTKRELKTLKESVKCNY